MIDFGTPSSQLYNQLLLSHKCHDWSCGTWFVRLLPVTQSWWTVKMECRTLNSCSLQCSGSTSPSRNTDQQLMLWSYTWRVVNPPSLCGEFLISLHTAHQSVTAIMTWKDTAIFWPGITSQIAHIREHCGTVRASPMHPLPYLLTQSILFSTFCSNFFTSREQITDYRRLIHKLVNYHKN